MTDRNIPKGAGLRQRSSTVDKIILRLLNFELPSQRLQALGQLGWVVEHFANLKFATIVEASPQDGYFRGGKAMIEGCRCGISPRIDEENASARREARAN